MPVTLEAAVAADYSNRVASLINNNDAYWEYLGDGALPDFIAKFRKKLGESQNLTTILKFAKSWGKSTLIYKPKPWVASFCNTILLLADNNIKDANDGLTKTEKDIRDFNYLEPLLKANLEEIDAARQQHELKTETNETKEAQEARQKNAIERQAELYMARGLIYKDYNQYKYYRQAYDCFSRTIAFDIKTPAVNMALRKRAELYLDHGREAEALADLKRASNTSANAWTHFEYASALYVAGQHDEAIVAVRQALELDPEHQKSQQLFYSLSTRDLTPEDAKSRLDALISSGREVRELDNLAQLRGKLPLLLQAATAGDLNLVAYLLKQEAVDILATDNNGNNALHIVACNGHIALLSMLRGIDYNAVNNVGQTPIMVAAANGQVAMMEALLAEGVATKTANDNVLLHAIAHGQGLVVTALHAKQDLYQELVTNSGGAVALMRHAVAHQQLQVLRLLLNYHFAALDELADGENILHFAISHSNRPAVDLLLNFGADARCATAIGQTPSQLAEQHPALLPLINNAIGKYQRWETNIKDNSEQLIAMTIKRLHESLPVLAKEQSRKQFIETVRCELSNFPKAVELLRQESPDLTNIVTVLSDYIAQQNNDLVKSTRLRQKKISVPKLTTAVREALALPWHNIASNSEPKLVEPTAQAKETKDNGEQERIAMFCDKFEREIDKAYGRFYAVSTGELELIQDRITAERLKQGGEAIGRVTGNATAATAITTAVGLGLYLRNHYNAAKAKRMVDLFKAVTPHERTYFIRYTAERLANKYINQLNHLEMGSEGIERFAECAAARVIEYIVSSASHQIASRPSMLSSMMRTVKSWVTGKEIPPQQKQQKALYDIFLDGIIEVSSKFPQDQERLATINKLTLQDDWNSKGIFESTGIITANGTHYAHKNTAIDNYGYCYGTKEEAENRALTLGPNGNDGAVLWGPGRAWEARRVAPSLINQQRAEVLFAARMPVQTDTSSTAAPKPANR